jgi:N4-gp56 family major capsid protein
MVDNVYGNGTNSTAGANTVTHFYDKAGVRAANAISVYAQFADRRSMPLHMGKTYKVSKWLHIFDREDGVDADFASKGYLSARNIVDVSSGLTSDAALGEGAGAVNKQTIKKVTLETSFARYGEMIDYTDEVDMFSEDIIQLHYREELGLLANQRSEDLIQLDMLATTNVMYSGSASSLATVGTDSAAGNGSTDALSQVNYDLIRKSVRKLVRNRAVRNSTIITGSTKIDTRTVNKAFYTVIGPEVKFDLENVVRGDVTANGMTEYVYVPAYKYASATNLAEGEVGSMHDVRFIESESAAVYRGAGEEIGSYTGNLANTTLTTPTAAALSTFTGGTYANGEERFDVFPLLFPTKGSFATVGLKGNNKIKFRSQSPEKVELGNPYGTQGFFSYNMWYAGIILREERLLKVLVTASQ